MGTDTVNVDAGIFFSNNKIVVGPDRDDTVWVGTDHWLVRGGKSMSPTPDALSNITAMPEQRTLLTRECVSGQYPYPLSVKGGDGARLRCYLRNDNHRVFLRHSYCSAIEHALERLEMSWWQGPNVTGPVYITAGDDPTVLAVIMPVRL